MLHVNHTLTRFAGSALQRAVKNPFARPISFLHVPGRLRHTAIKVELVKTGRKKHFLSVFRCFPDFFPSSICMFFSYHIQNMGISPPWPPKNEKVLESTRVFLERKCSLENVKAIFAANLGTFWKAALCTKCSCKKKKDLFLTATTTKRCRKFQPALSANGGAKRVGLKARAAHPASIPRSQFGVHFPSHTIQRSRVVALHFSSGVYINFFFFFFPHCDKTLCWHNRNKHTQYCNTETILELKTI